MELFIADEKPSSKTKLAPGFRFHPTDEELVWYYLRRKVCGRGFRLDAISEIEIYKTEPWDLPSLSKLKTRDLEWYFFSVLDKKHGNGARTNRATEKGYWKTTGKDRIVYHRSQTVGMKKTLVYHIGRAPKGQRSNWVMHEYRLTDKELERAGPAIAQDAFVLCRVFQKSGSGPKNGEQYGAPFVEEEWEESENENDQVMKVETAETIDCGPDDYLDGHDLDQILGSNIPPGSSSLPLNLHPEDGSAGEETAESFIDYRKLLCSGDEQCSEIQQHDDKNLYDFPALCDMNGRVVKHEYIGESSNSANFDDLDFLVDEPFLDSSSELPYGDGGLVEDMTNTFKNDSSAFDMLECLTYFDANDDNMENFTFDPSVMLGIEDLMSEQVQLPPTELNADIEQHTLPGGQFVDHYSNTLPTSPQHTSELQNPFTKQASKILNSFPAPPAFASELPSKDAVLRLNSLSQPSSSVHVTTGMIQIRNISVGRSGRDHSLGKHENFNIVLSFGFSRRDDGSASVESRVTLLPGKTFSAISWGLFYFACLWVLILSISFKLGTCIYAK